MIAHRDYWELFTQLDVLKDQSKTYASIIISGRQDSFLCKDLSGKPFFLLRTSRLIDRPAFRLKHIVVTFDTRYAIDIPGFSGEDVFLRVGCDEHLLDLQKIFIKSIAAVLEASSTTDAVVVLDQLVNLFSPSVKVNGTSITGLWGELLFMFNSKQVDQSVLAWHAVSNQLDDFVFNNYSVEVKTTTQAIRVHTFRLEQVSVASDQDLLCSIMLERSDLGANVYDLAGLVEQKCDLRIRPVFWEKFTQEMSGIESEAESTRFVTDRAVQSITFYKLAELSKPLKPNFGKGLIQNINFELNLDTSTSLETDHLP
jgi:hypothetical protein